MDKENTNRHIFRCHCGSERVYGTGEVTHVTITCRPRLRCTNPDHPGTHLHEYIGRKVATWVDYVGGKDEFKKIPV